MTNPILEAEQLGQSFWYDSLSRKLLRSGELRRMIEAGIRGVTSNPAIFEKAIAGTPDYQPALRALVAAGITEPKALYERLAIEDIRAAAELLHPTYQAAGGTDGFVSLEVSPHLAHDTEGTVAEGRRLFQEVDRQNVMIKVPGTPAGMPAIERLVAEGVNVNVTLLFGLDAYQACAEAHTKGLEGLLASGGDPHRVSGVASFFLSRIDVVIDDRINALLAANPDAPTRARLEGLRGKLAIANAKLAYVRYRELTATSRWRALKSRGASPQRLLWASTGTKSPTYPKTMYVDHLIGPETVNTLPDETYRALLEVGNHPRPTLTEGVEEAKQVMTTLAAVGIDFDQVTEELLDKGIVSFATAFDKLLAALAREQQQLSQPAAAAPSHL